VGEGTEVALREVVIKGPDFSSGQRAAHGVWIGDRGVAHLDQVVLLRTRVVGILVFSEGELQGTHLWISDTQQDSGIVRDGLGILATEGAVASLRSSTIIGSRTSGVEVIGPGSRLELEDVVVRNTKGEAPDQRGRGLVAVDSVEVQAIDLRVEGSEGLGIFLAGGTSASLSDAWILDTTANSAPGISGVGLEVVAESDVSLRRGVIENSRNVGVWSQAQLRLEDSWVTRSNPQATGIGAGLQVRTGGKAELRRVGVENSGVHGVQAFGRDARLVFTDGLIRGSTGWNGTLGRGLAVENGASAHLERIVVDRVRTAGIFASGDDTELRGQDVAVRRVDIEERSGRFGYGISVEQGASAELERIEVRSIRSAGIRATSNARLVLEDAFVSDSSRDRPSGLGVDPAFGDGIGIGDASEAEIRRAVVRASRRAGLFVFLDSEAVLQDMWIENSEAQTAAVPQGRGVTVSLSSTVTADRLRISGAREVGVFADDDSRLALTDVLVSSTRSEEDDGTLGRGVAVESSKAQLERVAVIDSRDFGVSAQFGAQVSLRDVAVSMVRRPSCVELGTCSELNHGSALGILDGSRIEAWNLNLDRAEICGIYLQEPDTLFFEDSRISDSGIGVCVFSERSEGAGLQATRDVKFSNNGRNFEIQELPRPAVLEPLRGYED
jgi:hypothetical protein